MASSCRSQQLKARTSDEDSFAKFNITSYSIISNVKITDMRDFLKYKIIFYPVVIAKSMNILYGRFFTYSSSSVDSHQWFDHQIIANWNLHDCLIFFWNNRTGSGENWNKNRKNRSNSPLSIPRVNSSNRFSRNFITYIEYWFTYAYFPLCWCVVHNILPDKLCHAVHAF